MKSATNSHGECILAGVSTRNLHILLEWQHPYGILVTGINGQPFVQSTHCEAMFTKGEQLSNG